MDVLTCTTQQRTELELRLTADDELAQRVRMYLAHAGHRPVQMVGVEAHDGVVTLRGRVPSYYIRQLAISCAQHVAGVITDSDQIKASIPKPGPVPCCTRILNSN